MSVEVDQARMKSVRQESSRRSRERDRAGGRLAFWLVMPAVAVLAVIIGYPVFAAIWRSFFGDAIGQMGPFVGLDNYASALWGRNSGSFWAATNVTFFFTAVTVVFETIIGFAMALVMNKAFRGRGLMRASVLVPWAIPTAVTAVLWRWSFDPEGIINFVTNSSIVWTGSE